MVDIKPRFCHNRTYKYVCPDCDKTSVLYHPYRDLYRFKLPREYIELYVQRPLYLGFINTHKPPHLPFMVSPALHALLYTLSDPSHSLFTLPRHPRGTPRSPEILPPPFLPHGGEQHKTHTQIVRERWGQHKGKRVQT